MLIFGKEDKNKMISVHSLDKYKTKSLDYY